MAERMLMIMLHHENLLDEVLSALVELEITGGVVLDGDSMAHVLSEDVPIFAGLWPSMGDGGERVKTIFAPLVNGNLIHPLMRLCKDAGADFANPEIGRVYSWAVDYYRGPGTGETL